MFDKLDAVVKRFEELNEKLADPTIYDRQAEYKKSHPKEALLKMLSSATKSTKKLKMKLIVPKKFFKLKKMKTSEKWQKMNFQCMKPIFLLLRKN